MRMRECDPTFRAYIEGLLEPVDLYGGTVEAEATFRGHLKMVRMKERQTIWVGYSTWCMLYWVYAAVGVCCNWCDAALELS